MELQAQFESEGLPAPKMVTMTAPPLKQQQAAA